MRIRAAGGTPRHHHYVPQFYLRNFADDPERSKVTTVAKHGAVAVWARRSIESLGFERDLYLDSRNGVPFLYETRINRHIETPLSRSDAWMKIQTGRTDALDRTDKARKFVEHAVKRFGDVLGASCATISFAASMSSGCVNAVSSYSTPLYGQCPRVSLARPGPSLAKSGIRGEAFPHPPSSPACSAGVSAQASSRLGSCCDVPNPRSLRDTAAWRDRLGWV